MQIGGITSAATPRFNIHYGSFSKSRSSVNEQAVRDEMKLIQREIIKLRKALEAIHNPLRLKEITGAFQQAQSARALSSTDLDLINSSSFATLKSTEEINTTPTSYSTFEPDWTVSSAGVTIGGTYDGSNGAGTLTFRADREGTHGVDDLKIKVYAPDDSFIEDINIDKNDPIEQVYTLSNGLTLTLEEGELVKNNSLTVNVDDTVPTSFDPVNPGWSAASTAQPGITGIYNGDQGTGTLTFKVNNEGIHGEDDLQFKVYAPDGSFIENIDIDKNDPADQQYTLTNGLIFTLGAGEIVKDDTFTLDVYEAAPTDLNSYQPDWGGLGTSDAQATIEGTYDGSNGSGTLTFKVDQEGTHSVHNLRIRIYAPDDSFIEEININKNDPIDEQYALSNGLTLTLGNGDLIKEDIFTLDVTDSPPSVFTAFEPAWDGLFSDAQVTLDGTYDGSNGTGTFNFVVDKEGTHGTDDLKIKVYDPDGVFLENIDIKKEDAIDTQYTLSNGIILTLGNGDLLKGDTFTLTFNETIGSVVDPTKPFNGTGDNNPNLEAGFTVTDGSFDINGETINVSASDSINDVLDKINQSAAGVTATFDAVNEEVLLTQNTAGSVPTITMDSDTSGFIAAMKLDTALVVPGIDIDPDVPLAQIERFSSVQSGTFYINETAISLDVNADSLNDLIDRINSAEAGVTASLFQSPDLFSIVSNDINAELSLDSGGTGIFEALAITPASYEATARIGMEGAAGRKTMTKVRAEMIADKIKDAASSFNALFSNRKNINSELENLLQTYRDKLLTAVSEAFDSKSSVLKTKFGISFDFNSEFNNIFDFSALDKHDLVRTLTTDGNPVNELFFGRKNKDDDGLLEKLLTSVEDVESDLTDLLGPKGIFVDVTA